MTATPTFPDLKPMPGLPMPGLPMSGLVLDGLTLSLAGRAILRLSLRVEPGEIVSVMGPSGSGKSS
ncbi:MAG: hypothetical protein JO124_18595, partial [Hyphomicrobiales bacterium]|nr:hypothetical protein [Hyphomicrobiales bacterium]